LLRQPFPEPFQNRVSLETRKLKELLICGIIDPNGYYFGQVLLWHVSHVISVFDLMSSGFDNKGRAGESWRAF
jgi:hypothetical protein